MISPLAFLTFLSCLWVWEDQLLVLATENTVNKPQEIPETGLCNYLVGRKDAHTVDFRSRLRFCREMAADNLVLLDRHF